VVSHGFGYLRELALNGRWLALARELPAYTRCYPERKRSPWDLYWRSLWRFRFEPLVSRLPLHRRVRRLWRGMLRHARPDLAKTPSRQATWREYLNTDFIQEMGLVERRRAMKQFSPGMAKTEREEHHRLLNWGVMPFALEIQDRATGAFAVEPRYPFWDRRLVEFCLSLPPEQKLHRGWSRMVMRRGLAGILPPEIQWRPHKSNLGPMFDHTLLSFEGERFGEFLRKEAGLIDRYVDLPAIRAAHERWMKTPCRVGDEPLAIWKTVTLGLWLQHTGLTA
jgi:asparagine synthase (glutamine-hydrolysing)